MIVVTGAAGFIGSWMIKKLNEENFNYIIAVDKFGNPDKERNLEKANIQERVDRTVFFEWLDQNYELVEFIFHFGARTDTMETDESILASLNTNYTKQLWERCVAYQIPFIYASSAATYGNGEFGFDDDESVLPLLKPLNQYAISKHNFDQWAISQEKKPFFWAGLKFFNVYGPNEYHKGRMSSVVLHAYNQIKAEGELRLFKSHHRDYKDGEQRRDFIYVKDVVDVCVWLMHHRKDSGIYNLGTGNARSFLDLSKAIFNTLNLPARITFIDTPEEIRSNYQYHTEANLEKLASIGYPISFRSLEEGIEDYVNNYLK